MTSRIDIFGPRFLIVVALSFLIPLFIVYSDFQKRPDLFTAESFLLSNDGYIPGEIIRKLPALNVSFYDTEIEYLKDEKKLVIRSTDLTPIDSRDRANTVAEMIIRDDKMSRKSPEAEALDSLEAQLSMHWDRRQLHTDPNILEEIEATIEDLERQIQNMDPKLKNLPESPLYIVSASPGQPQPFNLELEAHTELFRDAILMMPVFFLFIFAIYLIAIKISALSNRDDTAGALDDAGEEEDCW